MTTATELDNLATDIDVAGPESYVDGGPELLPESTYNLILKEYEVGRDRDTGEFRGYINLRRLQVSGGEYDGRWVNDIRVFATPYLRRGVKVSMLGDLLRGIDDQAVWSGLEGAEDLLRRAIDQQIPIRVKLTWEAYDRNGFEQEGGLRMVRKSPEEKELRKRATVKYMRNFPQLPDGSHKSTVPGPLSGEMLEARLSIDTVIPSSKRR